MDDESGLAYASKKWAQFYRTHKSKVRGQIAIHDGESDEFMPVGHDPQIIDKFLALEKDPKKVKQRNDGQRNRSKNVVSHNLGRDSYARKAEKKVCEF
jgi:hypothetical protein